MFYPSGYYRAKARAALKGGWQTALLIALVVNLPTMLVQGVSAFTGNDLTSRLQAIIVASSRDGVYSDQMLVREISAFISSTGFLVLRGLELVAWLVTPCLALGMYKWLMDRLRGQDGPVGTVLCRLNIFLKAIGLQLLVILKVFLWMLPGIAVSAAAMIPLYNATDSASAASAVSSLYSWMPVIVALIAVPGVIAALRYALAEYVLADEPGTKVRECVRRSKELMRDQKKYLFFLMVSFLLWYLLEIMVSSFLSGMGSLIPLVFQMLAGLALNVYMSGSVAAFYLTRISGVPQPEDNGEPAPEELN